MILWCDMQENPKCYYESNSETSESAYFSENQLPQLATEKNASEQINMCFAAYRDPNWKPSLIKKNG